jgi:hypothetical protein
VSIAALSALVAVARYKTGWSFRLEHGWTSAAASCFTVVSTAGGGTAEALSYAMTVPEVLAAFEPVRLSVCLLTEDSTRPGEHIMVQHTFAVPDDPGMPWHRWLLECIHLVEIHEMCEAFAVGGQRPFYPEHGPDAALYEIRDRGLPEPAYREPGPCYVSGLGVRVHGPGCTCPPLRRVGAAIAAGLC